MARQQEEKASGWLFVIGLLILLALIAILAQGLRRRPVPGSAPALPATQTEPLNIPTDGPGAKETAIQLEAIAGATEQARLRLIPSPGPGTLKPEPDVTLEPPVTLDNHRPAGAGTILWNFSPPFPGGVYQLTGYMWVEIEETTMIEVFAGAERNNPNDWNDTPQGMVFVFEEKPNGAILGGHEYKTPIQVGPVEIIDAQGERLILRTQSRSNRVTFYFDIPARQFVDSLSVTVTPSLPTATPAPSPYPS